MFTRDYLYQEQYDIPFCEAKTFPCYKCEKANYIDSLAKILAENNVENIPSNNVPIMIQFGCIDIELTLLECDDNVTAGFVICYRNSNCWDTHGYAYKDVQLTDNLEKDMFTILMEYAQGHGLTWSYPNDIDYLIKNHSGEEKTDFYTAVTFHNECLELNKDDERLKVLQFKYVFEPKTNLSLKDINDNGYYHVVVTIPSMRRDVPPTSIFHENISSTEVYEIISDASYYMYINIYPTKI